MACFEMQEGLFAMSWRVFDIDGARYTYDPIGYLMGPCALALWSMQAFARLCYTYVYLA